MALLDEPRAEESATEGVGTPTKRRRRRWPWVVAIVIVVVALIAGGTRFVVWADHYQPLGMGNSASGAPGSISMPGSKMTRYDYLAAVSGHKYIVDTPHADQTFEFFQSVGNYGKYGVTITKVSTDQGPSPGVLESTLKEHASAIPAQPGSGAVDMSLPGVPIVSYRLGKGDQIAVHMVERVPHCANVPNQAVAEGLPAMYISPIDTINVTYRFLWFTHTTKLPISEPIAVINVPHCNTPSVISTAAQERHLAECC